MLPRWFFAARRHNFVLLAGHLYRWRVVPDDAVQLLAQRLVRGRMGPAAFDDAVIDVQGDTTTAITLR